MSPGEVAALYARIHTAYDRVAERFSAGETDLDAIGQVVAAIDADLAAIPPPTAIAGLDPAGAGILAAAARACDNQRQRAITALLAARQAMIKNAAEDGRATRAAQAYRSVEGPGDGRFVDQRR